MRLTVFLVMLIWTMYRFVRLEHATSLSEHFYSYTGATAGLAYMLAIAELLLLTAFVLGMAPRTADHLRNCVSASGHFNFFLSRAVSPPLRTREHSILRCMANARGLLRTVLPPRLRYLAVFCGLSTNLGSGATCADLCQIPSQLRSSRAVRFFSI